MTLDIARQSIEEAIQTLDLVLKTATDPLADLLANNSDGLHPKALCAKYRKDGEQISAGLKKQLGIRKNGFLSENSYAEISDKGLEAPLDAHYTTLLRAHFTYTRAKNILTFLEAQHTMKEPVILKYSSSSAGDCATCDRLDETQVEEPSKAAIPPNGCTHTTCPMHLVIKVDWLAGVY